jgi:hypothetical protein
MTDEKITEFIYARIKREFDKVFVEQRPVPFIYLMGYKTAMLDLLFDYDRKLWKRFMKKHGEELKKMELEVLNQ